MSNTANDTQAQEDRIGGSVICPVRLEKLWALKDRVEDVRRTCMEEKAYESALKLGRLKRAIDDIVRAGGEMKGRKG